MLIAFIGSVFSPYYFRARQSGIADPYNHCALNVALYAPGRHQWAFTEYARSSVHCETHSLGVGSSVLSWDGECLTCRIDETAAPLPSAIRGVVRLHTQTAMNGPALSLDREGVHHWRPIIPRGRVEVELDRPGLRWQGTGYLDTNFGTAALEDGFRSWTWLRAHTSTGTTVLYDAIPAKDVPTMHALRFTNSGQVQQLEAPPRAPLPRTLWRVAREAHADFGFVPKVTSTLEDAPFYARSLLDTFVCGERVTAIHESLSLERFRSSWVRALLPFRMRRSRR